MHHFFPPLGLLMTAALVVSGCGGSSGGTAPGEGRAIAGPVTNATVTTYQLNGDGSRGAVGQTTTSDDNGNFRFGHYQEGPLEIVVTGGSYVDEATGETVEMTGREMSTLVATSIGQGAGIAVTPLTNAAATQARLRIANGEAIKEAIGVSNTNVAEQFGLGGVDITTLLPTDLTDPTETSTPDQSSTLYAVAIAALSQTALDGGMSPDQTLALARNIGEDLSDGSVDDSAGGKALSNDLPVSSYQTVNEIERQADTFLAGERNRSGITLEQVSLKPDLTCPSGMVKFVGGSFTMGDDTDENDDNPEHRVTLSDFCIDAKEVTQTQYDAWGGDPHHSYGYPNNPKHPAEKVDWTNAQAYCKAYGKRLPTEAEWEYAARNGGTATIGAYANGTNAEYLIPCRDANYDWCVTGTEAVGSYAPSLSGLYDMAGNVMEWTGDRYAAAYYADGQVNPAGPASGNTRVLRGGAWFSSLDYLRASHRWALPPDSYYNVVGFRCANN